MCWFIRCSKLIPILTLFSQKKKKKGLNYIDLAGGKNVELSSSNGHSTYISIYVPLYDSVEESQWRETEWISVWATKYKKEE